MASQPQRPNVLIITWHDLGDWLGCYGYDQVSSPHADALAAQGARFTNTFSAAPVCCPSRAAMMTGLLPHATGVLGQVNRGFDLDRRVQTIPQVLRDAGYATYLIGNSHVSQDPYWEGYDDVHTPPDDAKPALAEAIFARHRDNDERPFFLSIPTFEVHRPFGDQHDPELVDRLELPPYLPDAPGARLDQACFHDSIRRADEHLGAVLRALDESGLADKTLVIFTSDHGAGIPRAKHTLYDPGLRIALLMRWPKVIASGTCIDAMISNMDLCPTILALTDCAPHPPMAGHGIDVSDLLRGVAIQPRDDLIIEQTYGVMYFPLRGIRTHQFKYILNFNPGHPIVIEPGAIHRYGTELIEQWYSAPLPEEELYDLGHDPHEFCNVATDCRYGAVRRDLRRRLLTRLGETGDPLLTGPVPDPSGPQTKAQHFDRLWRQEEGLFRVDLPSVWQRVSS